MGCRFQQCCGPLNTLISKGCFERAALGQSSEHIFRNQQIRTYSTYEGCLFFKMLKTLCRFRKYNET